MLIHHTRSLCLAQPEHVQARFALDAYSGKYEARMSFVLPGDANHPQAIGKNGVSVTDVKWRALGRSWLGENGGQLMLEHAELFERLRADALYLTLGLSRAYQGQYWPLVVGVHVVPDYDAVIDMERL